MVQNIDRIRPPGRNDPCPCGSGKKYKRCCLLRVVSIAPVRRVEDVLADVHEAEDDPAEAIRILEDARHDLPDPELSTLLVERYLELPPEEAEPALRRWWEEEHDRFSGAGLARILVDRGGRDEAIHVLNDSRGAEAWPEYWRLLAQLRDEDGDTQGAAAAMELYTRVAPENVEAWMTLGDLQLRLGQHDRALASFRRAGDAVPDHIVPRMARLRILAEHNRWREARDLAEALLEGHYEDAEPDVLFELRDLLARAYFVLGFFDGARRLWESLLGERQEDRAVLFQLASLELTTGRHQRVVALLEPEIAGTPLSSSGSPGSSYGSPAQDESSSPGSVDLRLLETYLRALLALNEFEKAAHVAGEIEEIDSTLRLLPLIHAAQGVANKEYVWALDQVSGEPPEPYRDLWYTLRLECLAYLGRWQEMWPVLRVLEGTDDAVLMRAALGALAAGKLDLVERLLAKVEDQQSIEARSLSALLGPVRQSRRAAEIRRQQHVDQAERQRWTAESRELRRHIRDLEEHNAALAERLALSEESFQRLLERVGVLAEDSGATWEAHVQGMAERAHKDALARELNAAEQRLLGMLGSDCWEHLSEAARASLREGEWLFAAVEGADRDYGAALLEFARGLERAFKDAIFIPARARWQRWPGPAERLQDEGHDPSLGPFVRFVLQGSHLTLGSMAAALDRMSDIRRQGVAVNLLRGQIGIDGSDERALADWKRAADRLAVAADARNQPAHAAAVSRDAVREFRELVLGTDGLLHVLAAC